MARSRILSITAALAVVIAATTALAAVQDMNTLIKSLSDPSPSVREDAAKAIRARLKTDPSERIGDRGKAHWEAQIAKTKPGMSARQVAALLPSADGVAPDEIWRTGPTSGRSGVGFWRVDEYWVVVASYRLPDSLVQITDLRSDARPVWVQPPARFTGTWRTFHVNGQPHSVSEFRDGQYEGTIERYYGDGTLSYRQRYTQSKIYGVDEGWHRDGSPAYRGHYKDGQQDGTWTHWAPDGSLRSRYSFANGRKDGLTEAWHENGQLARQVHYKNGQKDGIDKEWDDSGKLLWSRHFKAGELVHQDPIP